jgi:hypothetical protein
MESDVNVRMAHLERRVRRLQVCVLVGAALVACVLSAPSLRAQGDKIIRARSLVIEDSGGRDRIILGAPLADPQGRVRPSTGMVINDEQGAERFAVGLLDNRRLVMGFDAPPGTGDPRNRERITIVADDNGGAYIRFLNRKTRVPGRLLLDTDDRLYLEFLDTRDGKTMIKRLGFDGERTVEAK